MAILTTEKLIEIAVNIKIPEILKEADYLISESEKQFSENRTKQLDRRWMLISSKKGRGISLTASEEKYEDDFDEMTDYQDQVRDASDLAIDSIELFNTIEAVRNYNPAIDPLWPVVWIRPV